MRSMAPATATASSHRRVAVACTRETWSIWTVRPTHGCGSAACEALARVGIGRTGSPRPSPPPALDYVQQCPFKQDHDSLDECVILVADGNEVGELSMTHTHSVRF